uniref:tRNA-guanine transglycosylase n=1 Tax=Escherichia coli TaxID=562 RepID=A0A0U3AVQ8_ECOLX|nr:tRNA-guanine transglycosylase [Escherichia coli]ALT06171.1 tRNA-guanine transglycosylase [Escherichia coli]
MQLFKEAVFFDLRDKCADALKEIGFDGYGFGGFPVNGQGELVEDILAYTASLMPNETPKYAMGLGKPDGVVSCYKMGYNLFDCVIPTREARHNRLYVFDEESDDTLKYRHYYILDEEHIREKTPISKQCDCLTCRNYTRAYLYHLYKVGDSLGYRLATIHNLRFYTQLMEKLQRGAVYEY